MEINQILNELQKVNNKAWGRYVLENDEQFNKINPTELDSLIIDSIDCGISYAKELLTEDKTNDINQIITNLNLSIIINDQQSSNLFSDYKNNTITIYPESLKIVEPVLNQLDQTNQKLFSTKNLTNILLAFELFSYLEEKYQNQIYTKTKQIKLIKIFKYEYTGKVKSLSKLAAAFFVQTILNLDYSPLILDILLLYPTSPKLSVSLAKHIFYLNKYFN